MEDRGAGCPQCVGPQRVRHSLVIEQQHGGLGVSHPDQGLLGSCPSPEEARFIDEETDQGLLGSCPSPEEAQFINEETDQGLLDSCPSPEEA